MELWIGAVNLGFLYAFMAIGTFITYKIFDFPDITVDGSFTTGAAVSSVLIISGMNSFISLPFSFLAGAAAGMLTAIIHTRFNINGLLSGILVMTGLYSINLRIMDRSNIPLLDKPVFVSWFEKYNPGLNPEIWLCICIALIMIIVWFLVSLFFKTDTGITMRATGNNPIMISASGVNVNTMKIFGVSLANGFVGLSGGLVAQYQGFVDIGMGVGAVVFSLASVIIGEAILKKRSMFAKVLSVIIGSIIFRLMVALALFIGLNPNDLKLITAVFVLITLVASGAFGLKKSSNGITSVIKSFLGKKKVLYPSLALIICFIALFFGKDIFFPSEKVKPVKIGIAIASDAQILTLTRDGFIDELKNLGYEDGKNCTILEQNANGDIPTVSSIIDNFINQGVDIFIPISTASTQAAANKIKDKPVVFATVANPFKIGVGKSITDHPANITGTFGTMPIAELMTIVRKIYPGRLKIGAIWNPAYPNSINNLEKLKDCLEKDKEITLIGTTITSSSEVNQAALSLVNKGIDIFFLIPDLTVFAAFESVVKAARIKNIPIFSGDVERLPDGALAVYGYDYVISGRQAAHMVYRIINGESPANIPYEKYKRATIGINLDIAKKLGKNIPDEVLQMANTIVEDKAVKDLGNHKELYFPNPNTSPKKVAVFQFADNLAINLSTQGIIDGLKNNGLTEKYNLVVDQKNANGDFGTAQSIAKDIVSKKYDYILTVSTISLQVTANSNKNIPHVFCCVTDPVVAGVAKSFDDHYPNITGLATPQPAEAAIKLMREAFPKAKTIGLIWNNSEANSEFCTKIVRATAPKYGFNFLERTVSGTNEIEEALNSLINENIDIFFTSGDITVTVAAPMVARKLAEKKIPYFTNNPDDINSGSLISIGANYYEVGLEAVNVFQKVLNGNAPKDIPIIKYVPENLAVNLTLAKKLNIKIPETIIKKAKLVK